jgi:hypothetical protein
MPTGVRFPLELRVPDRTGHGDSFEEIRSAFEPEIGVARRRNRMRAAPRIFELQWTFEQDSFRIFDRWWQFDILAGAREFDIQLLDDDETIVWFTVRVLGEYETDVSTDQSWTVTMRVRAIGDTFGAVRPSGTNELIGVTTVGLGIAKSGAPLIDKLLGGAAAVGVTATGRPLASGLGGQANIGLKLLPTGKFAGEDLWGSTTIGVTGAGQLSTSSGGPVNRQWMGLGWLGNLSSQDLLVEAGAVSREWMEI